ncbi:MAG: nitrite/sulfite reductase [Deltaproteobacteria bacterium]|nr:nitrite/sulfite reductase [Deltaproteobacteria bacterium]
MSQAHPTWKSLLAGRADPGLEEEIAVFETEIELKKQGRIDDKLFAETRLRRGVYGQRYDNGQRHDGQETRTLAYPCGDLKKGPDTVWDAPGMQRIKIPMGLVSAEQMDVMAELAEEYSDSILHVTTRQDIQLHFVHIEDTPPMMRRLAAVGITTREACGNSVRNVTACQFAGVCAGAPFDITPYAHACTQFLLGHKDIQDFGRKFKIAFSGCKDQPCGLANFHDLGAIATVAEDGRRGFELYVGGGLGAVPHKAKLLSDFVAEDELLPTIQAVCRVFARLGEKKNRAKARLKFLVKKLGIDEFGRLCDDELAIIPHDERWTRYLGELDVTDEQPTKPGRALDAIPAGLEEFWRSNVQRQSQDGYAVVTVRLPLGDFTSDQARGIADLARKYCGDTIRLTVDQNLVLRWVPEADVPALHKELVALELGTAGAGGIVDVTACPGTDTCKLGISASRGLARVLSDKLADADLPEDVERLHIKASGCFNSCAQHHVADIGFLGVSRNVGGRRVAHFQLVVGGQWDHNGASYGLAVGAFPSKRIPEVVDRLTQYWQSEREPGERFQTFMKRVGRAPLKKLLDDLRPVPGYDEDPSFYTDWGDAREYTIGDMGVGECAGEIVTFAEFGLADSERAVFEAQLRLETQDGTEAARLAYQAMLSAARALVRVENIDVTDDPDDIVGQFRERFYDTGVFKHKSVGGRFASYLFRRHGTPPGAESLEAAHHQIEEAQLFIEAAHRCYDRLVELSAEASK